MPRGRSQASKDRRRTNKKFGSRAERKAKYAAKKSARAAKRVKREARTARRIGRGFSVTRERSASQRVKLIMLSTIKAEVKQAPVIGMSSDTMRGGYTPFTAAVPGKLNVPWGNKLKWGIGIGGGAGRGPTLGGAGNAGAKQPGPAPSTISELRALGGRYGRTASGKRAISAVKATAAVTAGAIAGVVADDVAELIQQQAASRMGPGAKVTNTMFNPTITQAGVGVYYRNKLISLLTDEQYDQFWRNAATHIRKYLKAL